MRGGIVADICRFGEYELDLTTLELRRQGRKLKLAPQPARVLALLASRAGDLVTRDELYRELWGDRTFVDFERGLNYCLNCIRAALRENARSPRYIETLSRRGYRFICDVAPAARALRTLAVLPFENLNHDPEQDFFADGIADALTTELGNVSALRVISRQSVLHLKGSRQTIPEIARRLKIDAVVEGSVLQAGGRVRITAQLVQAAPEQHLWAKAYECAVSDILTTQGAVARAIAGAVEVALSPAEEKRLARARPIDPEAHVAYLKGRHHMGHGSREGYAKALDCFREAIEKDPSHALAHANMADCYSMLGHWGHLPFLDAFRKSKEAAGRALALDDALSSAHGASGWAAWVCDWDLETCEAETLRAIELNPSDPGAHTTNAMFLVTTSDDRLRAVREMRLALDLDPLSQLVNTVMAWVCLFAKDYDRAHERARKTLELFPNSLQAYWVRGLAEACMSRYAEATVTFEKAAAISCEALSLTYLGCAHAMAGNADMGRVVLRDLQSRTERECVPPRCFVFLHAALGEMDRAFEFLERAYQARDSGLFWLRAMPLYEPLQRDPRFREMLRRLGIPRPPAPLVPAAKEGVS